MVSMMAYCLVVVKVHVMVDVTARNLVQLMACCLDLMRVCKKGV